MVAGQGGGTWWVAVGGGGVESWNNGSIVQGIPAGQWR